MYDISRPAGCISDGGEPGLYCYIQAIASPNFNDQYLYQILSGLVIPENLNFSCTGCVKSLMDLYDSVQHSGVDLAATLKFLNAYGPAQKNIIAQCGTDFPNGTAGISGDIKESVSSGLSISPSPPWFALFIVFVSVMMF